uniref:PA14 domain-containing protein n=2 Tax=Clytia hemisphaerica TaxID=252671 RepID=A0A7M5VEQ0_9CNID
MLKKIVSIHTFSISSIVKSLGLLFIFVCASVFLNVDFLKTVYSNVDSPTAPSKLSTNIQKELIQHLSLSKKLSARYESLIKRLDNDVSKLQKIFGNRDSNGSDFNGNTAAVKELDALIDETENDHKNRRNTLITKLIQSTNKPAQTLTHDPATSTITIHNTTKFIKSPAILNKNGQRITDIIPGAIVDSWIDFCMFLEVSEFIWHPMLPEIPFKTNTTSQLHGKEGITDNLYRRIYAYMHVPEDGSYDFKLGSRDGAEVLIHDTKRSISELDDIQLSYDRSRETVYLKIDAEVIGKLDPEQSKISTEKLYEIESKDIKMFKNRVYFIEILQGGKMFVKYSFQMKKSGLADESYTVVAAPNVFHTKLMSSENTPSLIKQKYNPQKIPFKVSEKPRLEFYKHEVLRSNELIEKTNLSCSLPVQKQYIDTPDLYWAYYKVLEPIQTYPPEFFDQETSGHKTTLTKEEGEQVANMTFKKLSSLHGNDLELVNVVHIQKNLNKDLHRLPNNRTYFFAELDVRKKSDPLKKVYRASHFLQPTDEGDICFMKEWNTWREGVTINLLTPIKNQFRW